MAFLWEYGIESYPFLFSRLKHFPGLPPRKGLVVACWVVSRGVGGLVGTICAIVTPIITFPMVPERTPSNSSNFGSFKTFLK